MRVSFLKVEGYRSLNQVAVKVPQICALVGPNNSGKSNILRALKQVLERDWLTVDSFSEEDVYGRSPEGDIQISVQLDPPVTFERNFHKTEIHGIGYRWTRYKIGPQKGKRRLEHIVLDHKGETPKVPKEPLKKDVRATMVPLIDVPMEVRAQIPLIYIGTNRSLKDQLPGGRNSLLKQLLTDIDQELRTGTHKVTLRDHDGHEVEDTRLNHFNALMGRAMDALRTDQFRSLEATIKTHVLEHLGLDPSADVDKLDFAFQPFDTIEFFKMLDLRVKDESGFSISASELGDGLQNAMVLAILRAFESTRKKGAILLIEEPEMFLHPQMQRSMYKTLREIGKNNQVIYTTHSPHFVSVPEYNEVLVVRKGIRGTEVTASEHALNDGQKLRMQKELTPDRNELFFANRVLVVEGDTEKLTLPVYAQRLGIDLDAQGLTILEVGGKNNLLTFARIAVSLGIPTGILFDVDRKPEDMRDNSNIYAFETDGHGKVWASVHEFEAEMRRVMTDEVYNRKCDELPRIGTKLKPARIAEDEAYLIPEVFKKALLWLAGREARA